MGSWAVPIYVVDELLNNNLAYANEKDLNTFPTNILDFLIYDTDGTHYYVYGIKTSWYEDNEHPMNLMIPTIINGRTVVLCDQKDPVTAYLNCREDDEKYYISGINEEKAVKDDYGLFDIPPTINGKVVVLEEVVI